MAPSIADSRATLFAARRRMASGEVDACLGRSFSGRSFASPKACPTSPTRSVTTKGFGFGGLYTAVAATIRSMSTSHGLRPAWRT
jgi:hypothetical protein